MEIEKRKEVELVENNEESFIAESEHIQNKVLFDCVNESLNQFRPYGKEGVPMPWSKKL
jgi:hypothetical protein